MITRHEANTVDLWSKLSAPLPATAISWRQDGKPTERNGKFFARFVAYTDAQVVRERLDSVAPGDWSLTLELLPSATDEDGVAGGLIAFKARLTVMDVNREDVGQGKDYKSASTDAFKRAAVRFGIAHELYDYEQNWVEVDGDGRYAKPLEDPGTAYARRQARAESRNSDPTMASARSSSRQPGRNESPSMNSANGSPDPIQATTPVDAALAAVPKPADGPLALDEPSCVKCGGRMWDNRLSKRNPKAPDWKCRNRSCDGVIWPAKKGQPATVPDDDVPPPDDADGPIPF